MLNKARKQAWTVSGVALTLVILNIAFATPSQAVITNPYNWNGPHIELSDPPGDDGGGVRDITKIYYAYDSANNTLNFKIDIMDTPQHHGASKSTHSWGFYIDAITTGGMPVANEYKNQVYNSGGANLPGQTDGIDYIIRYDIYKSPSTTYSYFQYFQKWDSATSQWVNITDGGLQWRLVGSSIEFQINNSYITGMAPFNLWGATFSPGSGGNYASVTDHTGNLVTPIPNAAWLLGAGVVALVGLKRRGPRP